MKLNRDRRDRQKVITILLLLGERKVNNVKVLIRERQWKLLDLFILLAKN